MSAAPGLYELNMGDDRVLALHADSNRRALASVNRRMPVAQSGTEWSVAKPRHEQNGRAEQALCPYAAGNYGARCHDERVPLDFPLCSSRILSRSGNSVVCVKGGVSCRREGLKWRLSA